MGFNSWPPFWRIFFITFFALIFFNIFSTTINYYLRIIGCCLAIPHLSWLIARLIKKRILPHTYVSPSNKCVLVTGCHSGFGNQVARNLDKYGFKVFAGCLFPEALGAIKLKEETSKNLQIVKLDVTKSGDVDEVVHLIKLSGCNLWAVVNNAGVANYLPAEWGHDVEEYKRMFEVNVYGLVRVTKACLPLIRKSKGRVVNLASMTGRITFSGLTQYCMSKFAVRSFSDGLRREMLPFGVKVVTIEPMMYSTNIMNVDNLTNSVDRAWNETDVKVQQDYGIEFKETFKRRLTNSLKTCRPQIDEVVNAITEGVSAEDPEISYKCCGPGERPGLWIIEQVSALAQDFVLTGKTWSTLLRWFSSKN